MQQNFIFINFLQSFNLFQFFFFLISNAAVLFEENLNNGGNAGGVGSSVSAYEENFGGTTIKRHKALGKNTNLSPYSSGSAAQFVSFTVRPHYKIPSGLGTPLFKIHWLATGWGSFLDDTLYLRHPILRYYFSASRGCLIVMPDCFHIFLIFKNF